MTTQQGPNPGSEGPNPGSGAGATTTATYGSLSDRAYHELRDRLVLLDIPAGAAINEGRLGEELGIGRTPIREALKQLERDHLVQSFPRRGTFATRVDITDLVDVAEMRRVLEPLAASRAARLAGPAVRADLLGRAARLEAADLAALQPRELMRADLDLHRAIYRASGNPHLEETLVRLDNLATRIWCLVMDRLPDMAQHISEHAPLLHAIADGDEENAARLAREHVEHFEGAIRQVL